MSLNSVVNNLVRAAAGIPADISDKDLDQHVAGLLAKEAKEREMKWSEIGLGGLLGSSTDRGTPDPNAPKPNKRFLASVIRTVDTHNSSIIRQQLEAAETARSNSGLGESSRSAASRMFGGAMRDAGRSSTKGKHRDRNGDDRRSYDSRDRDRDRDHDRGRRDRDRDRSAERWHDKRQASRERRTRYDVDEEEEMYNAGIDKMADRKVKRDWLKRKEERDKRRKAREEAGEDEESERRRRDLYGDGDGDEDKESRRSSSRRDERERDRDVERSPRKSRREEESDKEDESKEKRERRQRDSKSPEPRSPDRVSSRRRRHEKDEPEARLRSSSPRDRSPRRSSKRNHDDDASRTNGRSTDQSPPSKSSRSKRHSHSPPSRRSDKPSRTRASRAETSPSPGPSAPPPPDLAPPPPDSPPPPPPPPAPASKMDKYFQSDYDPRLDLGEVPSTGYVPEVGWDNMLAILKERGKKPRNRSPGLYDDPLEIPKVRLRRTPSPTLKEIEKAERRAKRAARGFDDDFETEAERSKRKAERKREKEERARVTQLGPGDGGGLFDVSYVKKGGVREWDVGK